MNSKKTDRTDRKIMILRALGYRQAQIAKELKVSQPAISQRIEKIRRKSEGRQDHDKAFWKIMLEDTPISLLEIILQEKTRK